VVSEPAGAAKQIARQLPVRLREHNLTLVSAGVAFYAFLAFVPALIVIVTVYGLVSKPADIQRQVRDFGKALRTRYRSLSSGRSRRLAAPVARAFRSRS